MRTNVHEPDEKRRFYLTFPVRADRKGKIKSSFFVGFVHVRSHPFTGFLWSICGPFAFRQDGKARWVNDASSQAAPVRQARVTALLGRRPWLNCRVRCLMPGTPPPIHTD